MVQIFYLFNLDVPNLYPISVINPGWSFGEATNPHATASYICGDRLDYIGLWCSNAFARGRSKGANISTRISSSQKAQKLGKGHCWSQSFVLYDSSHRSTFFIRDQ